MDIFRKLIPYKKFLPIDYFILETYLKPVEIVRRLDEHVDEKKTFRMYSFKNRTTKTYEGSVQEYGFEITRIIYHRNSFIPNIVGEIAPFSNNTRIVVEMKPHLLTAAILLIFCSLLAIMCFGVLTAFVFYFESIIQTKQVFTYLIPFFGLIFITLMANIGFLIESRRSKKFLIDLLEAHEVVHSTYKSCYQNLSKQ